MMKIESLYNIFTELSHTSSRKAKEDILKREYDNTDFKTVLKFLLDTSVVTGISNKKIDKQVQIGFYETESGDYDIVYLLSYLSTHNTGTDSDIAYVNWYMWKLTDNEDLHQFIKDIVTKSFRLGVDVKTCQKVYGKSFIPSFDVMLGTSIENATVPDGAWISISQKLNGTRCVYYKGKLYTRQGKVYTGCDHIISDIGKILKTFEHDMVFDGELILREDGLSDSEAFQKGTGIANSKDKDKSNLHFVIFDMMPSYEFENGVSSLTYERRRYWVGEILRIRIYNQMLHNISTVKIFYYGYDHSEIDKWLKFAEEHDMEGVMVNLDTPYECKRTKNLIKVKKFYTYDLLVTGVEEGTGKNAGKLGAVIVDFKGNPVKVGSGFTDIQRENIWRNPDMIVGSVIEVKYKEVSKNKDTGMDSLQFPVFVGVREECKEVSYE
jgi:DNA ligase-1